MQGYSKLELSVGAFVTLGVLALAYLSVTLGGMNLIGNSRYTLNAAFSSVGSLKVDDPVKIAGVNVGEVRAIRLVDFAARAELAVDPVVTLPEDTIASIQSAGLLGDVYVSLSPGASDKDLPPGGSIQRTEPAVSLTELISKYAFGNPVSDEAPAAEATDSPFADPLE